MRRTAALWILGLLLCWSSLGLATEWRVGMARTDITPTKLVWMAGYAARKHPAEGTVHPLLAKALVIEEEGGRRVVIVTLDLIGDNFIRALGDAIARRVHRLTGIEREGIVFNFSHTHCGPVECVNGGALVTYGLDAEQQAAVNEYAQALEDKLVGLIEEAAGTLRPGELAYGEGEVGFAKNRRERHNPDGPVDHTVPVLRVSDGDGKLLAVLFGYACHTATLSGDFYQYNGDYAGFAQSDLEAAHPGATAMFMAGCGGDVNPHPRGQLELAKQHGKSLAVAVDRALADVMHPVDGPLTVALERVDLPFVDPPTKEDLEKRRGEGNVYDQRLTEVLLDRIAERGALEASYPCPVQVVRFGNDLSLVALAGEPVLDLALRLRKQYEGRRLWVAGYSNEVFAYLPSERVLAEGGYEAEGAMKYFGWHGPFKPGVEDRVVGLAAKLLGPAQGTVGVPVLEDRVLLTSGKGGYHTYRIPAAVCTAKGTVLLFCEARKDSSSDFAQTHLLLVSSNDRGRTWSDPRIVWKDDSEPSVTIGNPCPVLDVGTGTVWIGFTRNNQRAFVTKSTDDGRTWATPTEITEAVKPKNWKRYWTGPGHGLQLARGPTAGRLIFPSYHIVDEGDRRVMRSHMVYSDDHGRSWQIGGSTAIGPPIDPEGVHLSASWVPGPYDWEGCECLAVERPDGRLYLTVRNQAKYRGKKAYAVSDDGGQSWSPLGLQDELPGTTCQSSILGLPGEADGEARILWSGIRASDRPGGRRDLTVFLSEDGGRSFPKSRLVHGGASAYCDMTALADGSVLIFYEGGTAHRYQSIRVARFNLDWLTETGR